MCSGQNENLHGIGVLAAPDEDVHPGDDAQCAGEDQERSNEFSSDRGEGDWGCGYCLGVSLFLSFVYYNLNFVVKSIEHQLGHRHPHDLQKGSDVLWLGCKRYRG